MTGITQEIYLKNFLNLNFSNKYATLVYCKFINYLHKIHLKGKEAWEKKAIL